MGEIIRIGLLAEPVFEYARGIQRGARRIGRGRPIIFRQFPLRGTPEIVREYVAEWRPHGLMGFITKQTWAAELSRLGVPLINVSNRGAGLKVPRVGNDDHAIGRAAAEHFLERGFRHFGYVGMDRWEFSNVRETAFVERLEQAGRKCARFHLSQAAPDGQIFPSWQSLDTRVFDWLASLPRPTAVFAMNDQHVSYVAEACFCRNVPVPEQVALLGVDNDPLYCELSNPPLSSVAIPAERIGYAAAELLLKLIEGAPPPDSPRLFPPIGVVQRASTDTVVSQDPELSAALSRMRKSAIRIAPAAKVFAQLPLGEAELDRRLRAELGRSASEQLARFRVERAEEALRETELPMQAVAEMSGFAGAAELEATFERLKGRTPSAYREAFAAARGRTAL